ncbi:Putative glycosyltransferase EpsE [Planctomycetes bacterium MalM25]|nr:Putative glycosyltransferase EpsE [Planctomycetes bacterium MalM25]
MPTPQISFVVPVHNAGGYLPASLASLRWQTHTDWEAVCVDDGSTDGSTDVIERFAHADRRFRLIRQSQAGLVSALNTGLRHARGPWIARMDGDDIALPDRLEKQLAFVRQNPRCVGLGGAVKLVDPDGRPIGEGVYPTDHRTIEQNLLDARGETIAHPTLLARRDAIESAGRYRHEYETVQDADLLLRLSLLGELANLSDEVLLYRQHPKNYCRVHYATIQEEMRRLIEQAHSERGTSPSDKVLSRLQRPARQTSLVGKWARKAARNGYLSTAFKLTADLVRDAPLSPHTGRVVAEVGIRSAVAIGWGRFGKPTSTPDWRRWDCPEQRAVTSGAA